MRKCSSSVRLDVRLAKPRSATRPRLLSHQLLVKWNLVALGSGMQSHQVLVLPGKPVASTSGSHSEVEHSVGVAKIILSYLTARCPEPFHAKDVPWYVATDDGVLGD
jgi:hypothetical protein